MKIVMVFDQVQAGAGGKENAKESLHAKGGPIGSAQMFDPIFKEKGIQVIGTLYCGTAYYEEHKEDTQKKMVGMIKKLSPDAVLCGPAFNYEAYAQMGAEIAVQVQTDCQIPVIVACSQENETVISSYKDIVPIVKMPKKGGIGLTDSLKNMTSLLSDMVEGKDVSELMNSICY